MMSPDVTELTLGPTAYAFETAHRFPSPHIAGSHQGSELGLTGSRLTLLPQI